MRRVAFLGITLVAVVALALTAASVETLTVGIDPEGGDGTQSAREQAAGADGGATTPEGSESDQPTPGDGGGGDSSPDTTDPPLWQVLASITLLAVGGLVVIYGLTQGETLAEPAESEGDTPSPPPDSENRRRLSADAPPTNDVYRVWLALREAVTPDGTGASRDEGDDRQSPADVATAAIEAGYDEVAVEQLTREFCAVRYGSQEVTAKRERRARDLAETLGVTGGGE